ncbi:hypothetical protein [Jatrophihabitans endophyticus]|uniref:hypothetical protein n=1 Tax=Jatrophihabitans endophyticus TaxID=1206085 RepID=UPI001356496C|nr:hypothetical protein [Jatrophihabitans endophyticus]
MATTRVAKRSKPGGPYRVTFAHASSSYGELGRVLLAPTADGRSLMVRSRDSAGRTYDGMLYGLGALFVSIGVAMAPLDDWHLKGPLVSVVAGVLLGVFARLMTSVNRSGENEAAVQAAALAFDLARQARGDGVAPDDTRSRPR